LGLGEETMGRGENCIIMSLKLCSLPHYIQGDEVKKNYMLGHVTCMDGLKVCTGYWLGSLKREDR
jgi:hypothetical protein